MRNQKLAALSLGVFLSTSAFAVAALPSDTAWAAGRIELNRLVIEPTRRPGLEYKYHHAGGSTDNFCFEGGVNCAIVIFDDDPVRPGLETVGYVVAS